MAIGHLKIFQLLLISLSIYPLSLSIFDFPLQTHPSSIFGSGMCGGSRWHFPSFLCQFPLPFFPFFVPFLLCLPRQPLYWPLGGNGRVRMSVFGRPNFHPLKCVFFFLFQSNFQSSAPKIPAIIVNFGAPIHSIIPPGPHFPHKSTSFSAPTTPQIHS